MMRSNEGGQVRVAVLVVVAVVAVVVGVAVGVFIPQVHQAYVTQTETSTRHTTETKSQTVHMTETLFTTKTGTVAETQTITYTERATATETLKTSVVETITATETVPPVGYEAYSKFGFSFEYPEGMTILELGLLGSAPTDDSGVAVGTLENDEYEVITVAWVKSATVLPLESALEGALGAMETSPGLTDLEIGERVKTTKAGHRMLYQYFNVTLLAKQLFGVYGVWYCDMSQRLYQLYLMYSEEDVLPTYRRYLDSFVCHS